MEVPVWKTAGNNETLPETVLQAGEPRQRPCTPPRFHTTTNDRWLRGSPD